MPVVLARPLGPSKVQVAQGALPLVRLAAFFSKGNEANRLVMRPITRRGRAVLRKRVVAVSVADPGAALA